MLAHAGGTTVLHLESRAIPKFRFRAPNPARQLKIAEILSTVDEAIESQRSSRRRSKSRPPDARPLHLQAQLAYDSRVRAQIRATVNASGREVANSAILNRLYFAWPERHEQERIVGRLDVLEEIREKYVSTMGYFTPSDAKESDAS